MIKPTQGRVVWFRPHVTDGISRLGDGQPHAAIIAGVRSDAAVNLSVLDHFGNWSARTNVPLIQDGDPPPADCSYAEWMPYQKGQAAKTEALEAAQK